MKDRLKRLVKRVFNRPTEDLSYLHKRNNLRLAIAFIVSNNIEGDYLEFGVFKGDSFIFSYKLFNEYYNRYQKAHGKKTDSAFLKQNLRFFAFDSFEGLPENTDQDIPVDWTGEKPMSYPRHLFEQNLKSAAVDFNKVEIIEGFYDKTLNPSLYKKLDLKKAAIIHVDCDLYESTKTVLDTIRPLIVDGTVIVFDDYFYYKGSPYKGERGAFNEWLDQNTNFVASELCKFYPAAAFILNEKDPNITYNIV